MIILKDTDPTHAMNKKYDQATIEESITGMMTVYVRNTGELWKAVGHTSSKSEAIDNAFDNANAVIPFAEAKI